MQAAKQTARAARNRKVKQTIDQAGEKLKQILPGPGQDQDAKEPKRGPGGRIMSESEMNETRPELVRILVDYSSLMDEAMRGTSRTKAECHVWEMDEEEAGAIAHVMLMRARKSAKAAERVRTLIDSYAYIKTGAILAPRFVHTVRYYTENGFGVFPPRQRRGRVVPHA